MVSEEVNIAKAPRNLRLIINVESFVNNSNKLLSGHGMYTISKTQF